MVPNVGVELERGADLPALALSWSGSLPFGPVTACRGSYWLLTLRADVFFPRRYPTTASANVGLAFW